MVYLVHTRYRVILTLVIPGNYFHTTSCQSTWYLVQYEFVHLPLTL